MAAPYPYDQASFSAALKALLAILREFEREEPSDAAALQEIATCGAPPEVQAVLHTLVVHPAGSFELGGWELGSTRLAPLPSPLASPVPFGTGPYDDAVQLLWGPGFGYRVQIFSEDVDDSDDGLTFRKFLQAKLARATSEVEDTGHSEGVQAFWRAGGVPQRSAARLGPALWKTLQAAFEVNDPDAIAQAAYLVDVAPTFLDRACRAAAAASPGAFQALLTEATAWHQATLEGPPLLARLVFAGETELVAEALERGADPTVGDPTPMQAALLAGREDVLARLAEAGAETSDVGGVTPERIEALATPSPETDGFEDDALALYDPLQALCEAVPHASRRAWLLLAAVCDLLESPDEAKLARARASDLEA